MHKKGDDVLALMNVYRLRGLVFVPLRPEVAYLALPCNSGSEFVLELVEVASGNEVIPVL